MQAKISRSLTAHSNSCFRLAGVIVLSFLSACLTQPDFTGLSVDSSGLDDGQAGDDVTAGDDTDSGDTTIGTDADDISVGDEDAPEDAMAGDFGVSGGPSDNSTDDDNVTMDEADTSDDVDDDDDLVDGDDVDVDDIDDAGDDEDGGDEPQDNGDDDAITPTQHDACVDEGSIPLVSAYTISYAAADLVLNGTADRAGQNIILDDAGINNAAVIQEQDLPAGRYTVAARLSGTRGVRMPATLHVKMTDANGAAGHVLHEVSAESDENDNFSFAVDLEAGVFNLAFFLEDDDALACAPEPNDASLRLKDISISQVFACGPDDGGGAADVPEVQCDAVLRLGSNNSPALPVLNRNFVDRSTSAVIDVGLAGYDACSLTPEISVGAGESVALPAAGSAISSATIRLSSADAAVIADRALSWTDSWADVGYDRRYTVALKVTSASPLTNFPARIALPPGAIEPTCVSASENVVARVDGMVRPIEVSGSHAWVSLAELNATPKTVELFVDMGGDAPTTVAPEASTVWTNADYAAVFHFDDSLLNSADPTTIATSSGVTYVDAAEPGRRAALFNDGYVIVGDDLDYASGVDGFTLSLYANPTDISSKPIFGIGRASLSDTGAQPSRIALDFTGNGNLVAIVRPNDELDGKKGSWWSTSLVTASTWSHLSTAFAITGSTSMSEATTAIINGAETDVNAITDITGTWPAMTNASSARVIIGSDESLTGPRFSGEIDEIRFSRVAKSAAWTEAERVVLDGTDAQLQGPVDVASR